MTGERMPRRGRRSVGRGQLPKESPRSGEKLPNLKVDQFSDAGYVYFKKFDTVDKIVLVDDLTIVDMDNKGNVLGIEFLDFSGGIKITGLPLSEVQIHEIRNLVDNYWSNRKQQG